MKPSSLLVLVAVSSACAGGPTGPSAFSLSGQWTGTLSVTRAGQPPMLGPSTWTFDPMPNTAGTTYTVTIRSQHPFLGAAPILGTATFMAAGPPGRIDTQGNYQSPRGCRGDFGSSGEVRTAHAIDASFHGIDCEPGGLLDTFSGSVHLTR